MKLSQHLLNLKEIGKQKYMQMFGGLYEHSPWIAETVWDEIQSENSIDIETLAKKLKSTVDNATQQQKLDLLCAHPELAGKAAIQGTLTVDSTDEQSRARLDLCSTEEFEKFHQLNSSYNKKFNFPFIMAVRNSSRVEILDAFALRIENAKDQEFKTALEQVHKIALLRLHAVAAAEFKKV